MKEMRIGHGYDVHKLEAGDGVTLGGVKIACPYRVIAHSDGDVLIHALCDAILGAVGMGDIGRWFPDTDARFRGIDSRVLLREVQQKIAANWRVGNADLTLIAQEPRVSMYVQSMCMTLANDLRMQPEYINVKATTGEGLGYIGRVEGIAAHASVLMIRH